MTQTLPALLLFLFPLAYSPGPGNLFFAASGARFGLRATLPANLGYHVATFLVTAALALGFATTLTQAPWLTGTVRVAGSLYVLWLAAKLFRAGTLNDGQAARPAGALAGALLLLLNPKAYVIIALMLSQFLSLPATPAGVLTIAAVFTLNNAVAFLVWTLAGDRIAALWRSPGSARGLNRLFGAALGVVALWMLAG